MSSETNQQHLRLIGNENEKYIFQHIAGHEIEYSVRFDVQETLIDSAGKLIFATIENNTIVQIEVVENDDDVEEDTVKVDK